jgi:glucosyl-dolichyl phosphate glucuronosyltransferase
MKETRASGYPDSVSVVVCAYTEARWDELVMAVRSLQQQTTPPDEIIVVIDHNTALLERVQATLTGVTVLANREPQGLSGARNTGIGIARGNIVAFMDEDAAAAPDWLASLRACYTHPDVLGVGGAIDPYWVGERPAWFPLEFDWVVGCTYRGMPTTATNVRNLIGCNMSFRRSIFAGIGGFRNGIGRVGTLPVGCEETELCIRTTQAWPNGVMVFQPRARVRHRVPASRATWQYFRSRCYAEGISKALIAQFVGANSALASERTYTLKTLPKGVLAGVGDACRGDFAGLLRAGAIAAGLGFTAVGYLKGVVTRELQQRLGEHKLPRTHKLISNLLGRS